MTLATLKNFLVRPRAAMAAGVILAGSSVAAAADNPDLAAGYGAIPVEPVWSGHPAGPALWTQGDRQFVAYYDANRQMSVAQRVLGTPRWTITRLDSFVGWDSHNYVTLAPDREGCLHVSGNMHVQPLTYFRSRLPWDASTLARQTAMTGARESRCTYPHFFYSPSGALVFEYRDGMSGQGDTLDNIYEEKNRSWRRLMDQPLFDGRGLMSCYPLGPTLGPDQFYHLTWVWRNTINAETNHDLSYARSRDLVHWETADGQPVRLPITSLTPGVVVDPIPVHGGVINGSGVAGFDLGGHVVISYHKFDAAGLTQLYFARFEQGRWHTYQASDWTYRWDFRGGGSLIPEIRVGALKPLGDRLVIPIRHKDLGSATWSVDPVTLRLGHRVPSLETPPPSVWQKVESSFPEMEVRWANDSGPGSPGVSYRLRWEALPNHRDQPRPKPWPEPSLLRVIVVPQAVVPQAVPDSLSVDKK